MSSYPLPESRQKSDPVPTLQAEGKLLGAGRSGEVYLIHDHRGAVARKIFGGDSLAKAIHYIFTGAPNPYVWNEDAVAAARYRREVAGYLIRFWFGSKLTVAAAHDWLWDTEGRMHILDTAFVKGRPVKLRHPFRPDEREVEEIVKDFMQPLQEKLTEAGLDGLVWQAGRGNPVALNNFLKVEDDSEACYALIDLESGVPALFPLNFWVFFTFYLPKSIRHRGALFDDVDTRKLKRYLEANAGALEKTLGTEEHAKLLESTEALEYHQHAWKGVPRLHRSVIYAHRKGRISSEEAEQYKRQPVRWRVRDDFRIIRKILWKVFVRLPIKVYDSLRQIEYRRRLSQAWRFVRSGEYRLERARDYVGARIDAWEERGQLNEDEVSKLKKQLNDDHSSAYLSDFSVHLGVKVVVQILEYTIFAVLLLMGVIGLVTFGLFFVLDGPIFRSLYTLFRLFAAPKEGLPRPWLALGVGIFPIIGNLAFPMQMIHSARGSKDEIGKFIVYDSFGRIGQKLPIVGGADTLTEHAFNRVVSRVMRKKR